MAENGTKHAPVGWAYCSLCDEMILAGQKYIHDIEEHGILPRSKGQTGNAVWIIPQALDPLRYELSPASRPYRCRHCTGVIARGQLHATRLYSTNHYCLACSGFEHGRPQAAQIRRDLINKHLAVAM